MLKRKRNRRVSRDEAFAAYPVRNASLPYERLDTGEVSITVNRRRDGWARLLALVFVVPRARQIVLDQVGSDIWELCDGAHTVRDIVNHVIAKYKLNRKEAEVSLATYLKNLGKRGLVGFAVPAKEGKLTHATSEH